VFVCVGLSVCDHNNENIVDGFAPNFMRSFLGEREDQVRVSLLSVEGRGSNGQKNSVNRYKIAPSGYSKLAGLKIVSVASVAKCRRQKHFRGDLYSLRVFSI